MLNLNFVVVCGAWCGGLMQCLSLLFFSFFFFFFFGVVAVQFLGKAECEVHSMSLFRVSINVNAVILW